MWLNQLKVAVIEKNLDAITTLLEDIPHIDNTQEAEQALYLLREASEYVHKLKDETEASMAQMQKNLNFLNSATANKTSKFDITS